MSKATPGPWSIFDELVITAPEHGSVAFAYGPSMPEKSEVGRRSLANARLIAAAPELLEALKDCLQTLTDSRLGTYQYMEGSEIYGDFRESADKARAAIAKAEGA